MPGVPSSKGCDACIKQKKKCDQLKPVCSRCSRLQISCTGSGKQRYKFKEVRVAPTLKEMETKRSRSAPSSAWSLSKTPSNEATVILNSFVHRLEVKDLRYDICWTYGNLLKEVPKRLGTNAALDASVCALTTVLSDLSTGQKSVHALARYGWALRALRSCLNDPLIARSSSTLCAIYLIWICQGLNIVEQDMSPGHGSGIVQILATAPYRDSPDDFERQLLMTIAGPVVFESLFDPTVRLSPWMRKYISDVEKPAADASAKGQGGPPAGGIMAFVIRLADFIRYNPELQHEIMTNYQNVHTSSRKFHEEMVAAAAMMRQEPTLSSVSPSQIRVPPLRLHAFYQRAYALFLTFEIILNGILHAYNPHDVVLEKESSHLSQEIINLSLEASLLKPLGAGWIALCFIGGWAATSNVARRAQIEKVWCECWADVSGLQLAAAAYQLNSAFDQLRIAASSNSVSSYNI